MTSHAPTIHRFWPMRLLAVAGIGVAAAVDTGTLLVVPVLFALIVPFEKLFPRHRGQRLRRPLWLLDVRYALTSPLTSFAAVVVGIVIGVVSLAWVPGLALRPLVAMIPGWLQPLVGIALFDLAIYWAHRWSHEVPALWRFHAVHHSTEQLDWISGFRNHPLDGAIIAPPIVLLLAAGFDPTFTGALAVVQFVTGLFLHANVRWRWRPLHRIVITPEFHHWHHANEADAHNTNYSVFLPLWDIMFGTYSMPSSKRPLRYGVSDSMPTTMLGQFRYPFAGWRGRGRGGWRQLPRQIAGDVWRSTTRARTRHARPGEPCNWSRTPPTGTLGGDVRVGLAVAVVAERDRAGGADDRRGGAPWPAPG